MKLFQAVYRANGTVESVQEMPDEPEKKRVLFIRAANETKALELAPRLYSFAK